MEPFRSQATYQWHFVYPIVTNWLLEDIVTGIHPLKHAMLVFG
jgi:hypothetical protein